MNEMRMGVQHIHIVTDDTYGGYTIAEGPPEGLSEDEITAWHVARRLRCEPEIFTRGEMLYVPVQPTTGQVQVMHATAYKHPQARKTKTTKFDKRPQNSRRRLQERQIAQRVADRLTGEDDFNVVTARSESINFRRLSGIGPNIQQLPSRGFFDIDFRDIEARISTSGY